MLGDELVDFGTKIKGMRRCVWLMAQLLDGKSSHRDKSTVPYFSPSRLRDVCTFAETQQRGRNTRARVGISGHARREDRRKFPRVACRPSLARARVFRPASLARAKSALVFSLMEEEVKTL